MKKLLFIAMLALAGTAKAQVIADSRSLDFDAPESWAAARAAAATLFLGQGHPAADQPAGTVTVGVELGSIPRLSREEQRVGFNGNKLEDLNKSPLFGRLRVNVQLPARLGLELGWTPPATIDGATPRNLYALALHRPLFTGQRYRLGARLYAQSGSVVGSITCSSDSFDLGVADFDRNPFRCAAPSHDDAELDYHGIELTGTVQLGDWAPFASLAWTRMDLDLQVDAPLLDDLRDRSYRHTSGETTTASLGLSWQPHPAWRWTLALQYTPLDVRRPADFDRREEGLSSVRLMVSRSLGSWRGR